MKSLKLEENQKLNIQLFQNETILNEIEIAINTLTYWKNEFLNSPFRFEQVYLIKLFLISELSQFMRLLWDLKSKMLEKFL